MASLKRFKIDTTKYNNGTWVKLGEEYGEIEIQTRGYTDAYLDARSAKLRRAAIKYGGDQNKLPLAESRVINAAVLVEHCLLGVKNLQDDKTGKEVPFELFKELVQEPEYRDLLNACEAAAGIVTAERETDVADAKKKLSDALGISLEWAPVAAMRQKRIMAGESGDDIICPDPEVPTELMWIWRSFSRLSADRPWHANGLSAAIAGSIPLSAILQWARYKEYDKDMTSYLDACVQEMDRTFLDHIAKKGK